MNDVLDALIAGVEELAVEVAKLRQPHLAPWESPLVQHAKALRRDFDAARYRQPHPPESVPQSGQNMSENPDMSGNPDTRERHDGGS